jgi:hypothetical protein
MRRGRRKFKLTAAHNVTTKKPSLLRTKLMRSRLSVPSAQDYERGYRCKRTTPQSG